MTACPKCGLTRAAEAEACARCGLVFARWNKEAAAARPTLDAEAEAMWAKLAAAWDDEAAHEAFVKHCTAADLLGPAGQRYRLRLDENPGDAIARRMQARIIGLATVRLEVATGVARAGRAPMTRSRWFWAVLFVMAAAGVAVGLVWGRGHG